MEIGDNIRTAIGYICIAIVMVAAIIAYILFWVSLSLPSDYTLTINISADDNLLNITETMERIREREINYSRETDDNVSRLTVVEAEEPRIIITKRRGSEKMVEACPRTTYFTPNLTNSYQKDCKGNIIWETDEDGNLRFGDEGGFIKVGGENGN